MNCCKKLCIFFITVYSSWREIVFALYIKFIRQETLNKQFISIAYNLYYYHESALYSSCYKT